MPCLWNTLVALYMVTFSVTRLAKFRHFGKIFKVLGIFEGLFTIWLNFGPISLHKLLSLCTNYYLYPQTIISMDKLLSLCQSTDNFGDSNSNPGETIQNMEDWSRLEWLNLRLLKKKSVAMHKLSFLNGPTQTFFYFLLFKHKFLQKKTVGFSGIRTRIVRVEGEHSDHLTTTTAHAQTIISLPFPFALQLQCLLFLHYYSLSLSLSLSHHPLPLSRNVLKMK